MGGLLRLTISWPSSPRGTRRSPRRARTLLVAALAVPLLAVPQAAVTIAAPPAAAACANEIACENSKPGTAQTSGTSTALATTDPGLRHRHLRSTTAQASTSRSRPTPRRTPSTIYRLGYYRGRRRPQDRRRHTERLAARRASPVHHRHRPPSSSTAATGPSRRRGTSPRRRLRRLLRAARRAGSGDASHIMFVVRDDASHSDVGLPDLRHHVAGLQHLRRSRKLLQAPAPSPGPTRSPTTGRSPPGAAPAVVTTTSPPSTRWCASSSATGTTSLHRRPDTDRAGQLLTQPQDLPVRRPRRVLERPAARQRRGRARRRRQPDVPQRQRDVLAGALGDHGRRQLHGVPTLDSYRETWDDAKIDPAPEWTGTSRDPRYASQANGAGVPENAVTGTMYMPTAELRDDRRGPARASSDCGATPSLANLPAGITRARAATVGDESDEDVDNGSRPPGLIRLSTTIGPREVSLGFGNIVDAGHDHAPHDDVPRRQRSTGLRRGHGPVDLGPRRRTRHRLGPRASRRRCSRPRSTCSPTWAPNRRR